jgi:hypothetical protein
MPAVRDMYIVDGSIKYRPVKANAVIYYGCLLCTDANGFYDVASDTAGYGSVCAVALKNVDNTSGTDGALYIKCSEDCIVPVVCSGLTVNDVYKEVFISDYQTVINTNTNNVKAGILISINTAETSGLLLIRKSYFFVEKDILPYGVAAGAVIVAETIVAMNTSGFLVPASDTKGLIVIGKAKTSADNTAGGNGAIVCFVETPLSGIFNSVGLALIDIGHTAYILDASNIGTQAMTTNSVVGGVIRWLDIVNNLCLL